MQSSKLFSKIAYLSLIPLFLVILLAPYQHFGWASITGIELSFAHINAYIYAHSYAALLLSIFAGIQIGTVLFNQQQPFYIVFNFVLMVLAWLSYQSYADFLGVAFLTCCWVAALMIDLQAKQQGIVPSWYGFLKLKINIVVILLLLTLLFINQ